MKRSLFAAALIAAIGALSSAYAEDQSLSPDRQVPPKIFMKDDKIVIPDTKMMSQQEQCQWNCWNAASSCANTGDSTDCNAMYQQCLSYCG